MTAKTPSLLDWNLIRPALLDAVRKLDPRLQIRNPVMFVTLVGAALTTAALFTTTTTGFVAQLSIWLWFTVLFANFAEAVAEGRGKAQADSLRKARADTPARRLAGGREERVPAPLLKKGDLVVCEAQDVIPADGEVVEGIATVDEAAITGESAPVIRESGGDRSAVTGGTRVISDRIIVRITAEKGQGFLDRMIAMVEGARRQKTPNEIALTILLSALTFVFLLVCVTLKPLGIYSGADFPVPVLVALLVCLIPTTIGGLLSAIGISGIDRLIRHNVMATSGRAVEAAGDVDVLLLDKTGTITLGNRMATDFLPAPGVERSRLADAAQLASLADETPEGRSIAVLAKQQFNLRGREVAAPHAIFVPFTAQTRMSGVDFPDRAIRKGAAEAVRAYVEGLGGTYPPEVTREVERVARDGGTPLVVAEGRVVLGVIHLKDVVKGGIRERFARLRTMGIKTIMITGDNPLTAAAIAAEAGVDDFLAQATPEQKLQLIRAEQAKGHLVAMTGDGTNDAPALAQADVGVAMNTGTQAAREAGNMVDLDSNPTKLIEIVEIGKQLLITRGSLTTFSIANDLAKYFAIIPAMLMTTFPAIAPLNVMRLHSPQSAILSAVIFNALIIIALIPLALRGVAYRPLGAAAILRRNLAVYGLGGVVIPFVGIKLVDLVITALGSCLNMKTILTELRSALLATLILAFAGCVVYPLAVYGLAQAIFPQQANGNLLVDGAGAVRGSALLAQPFTGPGYFHPRPSAAGAGYDAASSSGSNLGPTSQKLCDAIRERVVAYRTENGLEAAAAVPADAVTASGSGLDPHITPANAALQAGRVARARGWNPERVQALVAACTERPQLGVLGDARVNVVLLNRALDESTERR